MTRTQVRDALHEVRDAVEVPVTDQVAFRSRVRSERRRRTALRSAAAGSVAAAVAGVAVLALGASSGPRGGEPTNGSAIDRTPTAEQAVPLVLQGRLLVLLPDGGSYAKPIGAEEVLGRSGRGVVIIGRDSHVELVPLSPDGEPGRPQDLGDGQAVQRASLDPTGRVLAFVDLHDVLHLREVGSDADLATSDLTRDDALVATDGTRWLVRRGSTLLVDGPRGAVTLDAGEDLVDGDLAGGTVAARGMGGVHLFDVDGTARHADLGGSVGALSTDGASYAAVAGEEERDQGASGEVELVDTASGRMHAMDGYDADESAQAVWWQDHDRFLVLTTDAQRPGNHVLWECSVALDRCSERYDDPTGTLAVPTS